jgi:hypothetical protein
MYCHLLKQNPQTGDIHRVDEVYFSISEANRKAKAHSVIDTNNYYFYVVCDSSNEQEISIFGPFSEFAISWFWKDGKCSREIKQG